MIRGLLLDFATLVTIVVGTVTLIAGIRRPRRRSRKTEAQKRLEAADVFRRIREEHR